MQRPTVWKDCNVGKVEGKERVVRWIDSAMKALLEDLKDQVR